MRKRALWLQEQWRGGGEMGRKNTNRNDKPGFNDKVTLPTINQVLGKLI
jgi:hypothetical protein